ncbi:MAG: hypothetical protein AAF800_11815 [Planctomycetota bacterium]
MTRPALHPEFDRPAPGNVSESGTHDQADTRQRWRTVFVDGTLLDATVPGVDDHRVETPSVHVVARSADEVAAVRKNVQDSARAVMAWLAAVVGHEGKTDLSDVLDRCLRPGPDVERVNYAALAEDITRVTGVALTAKRVQTAVSHLRAAHRKKAAEAKPKRNEIKQRLAELVAKLRAYHHRLTTEQGLETSGGRDIGTEVLTAVRCAAGRVIDRGFGEGIPDTVDLHALEGRYLGFVRDTLRRGLLGRDEAPGLEAQLRRLLITLADHDATAEADMKLVMHGSAVVGALLGVDSLPGVTAQLNVLVAGRGLIDTDLYVAEMRRLAGLAEGLHDDAATTRYLNWNRRRPEDRRLPSAIRVASYCRSNAATRLYDRLFTGELEPDAEALADADRPARTYLELADDTHDAMLARDGGFTLTLTTETLRRVVHARLRNDNGPLHEHFRRLGPDKTLDRLEALIKFENNDELVDTARHAATAVFPALRGQLVCVR